MKAKINLEDFRKAVNTTARFSSFKPQIPVLSNILLSAFKTKLLLEATNLEISIKTEIGAKVESEGKITIPAKSLVDILTNLKSDTLNLSVEKESLIIESAGFKSKLLGINAAEFPEIPEKITEEKTGLPSLLFANVMAKVIFASSIDETKPSLTGILFFPEKDFLNLVATDGYRLSVYRAQGIKKTAFEKIIVPRFVFSEIPRIAGGGDIFLSYDRKNNLIVFETADSVVSSRVIEGDYPDFQKIIPVSSKTKVWVDKDEFLRLVRLASVFARDVGNVVKIYLKKNKLLISSESQYTGSQKGEIEAKIEGDDLEIAFNYKFLEDFLESVTGETILIELNDSSSPVVFKDASDRNYLHLIMPVKI